MGTSFFKMKTAVQFIPAGEAPQNGGSGSTKRTVAGNIFREGWGWDIGLPAFSINRLSSLPWTSPGLHLLFLKQFANYSNRPHIIIMTFRFPTGNGHIKQRIGQGKQ